MALRAIAAAALAIVLAAAGAGADDRPERHPPCDHASALRNPYFGDIHVHTRLSLDAATQGTRAGPREAYAFARGEPLVVGPADDEGGSPRTIRLERPLDFAAVTDHAELLGEARICGDPSLPGGRSLVCAVYRRWPRLAFYLMSGRATDGRPPARFSFCGSNDVYCLEAAQGPWQEIIAAAEEAYDRTSACRFTTFVGYEWTGAPGGDNLHRNVLFANDVVPDLPISYFEAPTPADLWEQLERRCMRRLGTCEALAIPHNSNLSGGRMFTAPDLSGQPLTVDQAAAWRALEPLVEVMQHKGDSECGPGSPDELCRFEKLPYANFPGKYAWWARRPPPPSNFVRDALLAGLADGRSLGVNPFRFGMIAGTDTHLGAAGATDEGGYVGHGGAGAIPRGERLARLPDDIEFNPGGLAVLWAEQNTRASLFAAMRRREAYGTSGPRITVRFFGGWELADDLCGDARLAERGYAGGVPMGGELLGREGAAGAPRFVVSALRDSGTARSPGAPLERVQIVKGWLDDAGTHERVFDVAVAPGPADVDLATCTPRGAGSDALCAVWADPEFDPEAPAFYYARVLEVPSCRWSTRACLQRGIDCRHPGDVPDGWQECCDAHYPKTIQERAWTSPIWYTPAGG
ncbi:MAG TPA: DUF3604 domain-containing protein [Candidatus Limnocylindria bacterium]|nr:DUF3604 domain-containing protein [Candidatus Limnocylindria bacterium]